MKIQFVQEPGYIHDLFYIFMLAYKTADAGSEEYAEIMQDTFGACPAELYTFFYPREDGETFMTSLYAEELASGRSGGVASLLEDLQDEDEVFRRFLQFYFPHFEEADSSVHSISRHIYESAYSDTLKFHLLSLCVDPAGHIRLLVKELQEKERLLKKYTEENFSVLLNLQAGLEPESLFRLLCPEEKMDDQNLEYSLSLLDKGLIQVQKRARYLLLLGCEYAVSYTHLDVYKRQARDGPDRPAFRPFEQAVPAPDGDILHPQMEGRRFREAVDGASEPSDRPGRRGVHRAGRGGDVWGAL